MSATRAQPQQARHVDAVRLAQDLERHISGEVRFDAGSRALYATDGSLYRQVPIGVVIPRSIEEVRTIVRLCREADAPLLARGAGTSLAGQCCNVAVVIDFSKYLNRILELLPDERRARVQPGCVLDDLRDAAEEYHLTFGPDPSTHAHNTLGGMIGNNSCGVHSVTAGRTADNVRSLKVLTQDGLELDVGQTSELELKRLIREGGRKGEIYAGLKAIRDRYADHIRGRFPRIPRRVSGYNLDELLPEYGFNVARALVGSEGTCVTVLEAELDLVPSPVEKVLLILGYEDVYTAADEVPEMLPFGPGGLEGLDAVLMRAMASKHMYPHERDLLPDGEGWLLLEFGGETVDEARDRAGELIEHLSRREHRPDMKLIEDPGQQKRYWKVRESGLGATSRDPELGYTFPGWEDAAVSPARLGDYLREFRKLLHRHGYEAALYGHFGDGCIHCRINFDLKSKQGLGNWHAYMQSAADLVVRYGGSLSGEHGDGQVRAELLPRMYGEELMQAFREFKSLWDPAGRMNPGKVVNPYPMTDNLREGPDTRLPDLQTVFDYTGDEHGFAGAVNRCVGIGDCRDMHGDKMCPSYRGTLEEQHSTRGRARLLFEMMRGDAIRDGWRSDAVREALDLCLACKACKRDCPVDVDMAQLKAEFMHHHYAHRRRPRNAYSMGLIWWWSRAAAQTPALANFILQTPGISRLSKWIGGIAPERFMPRYAGSTFTRDFPEAKQETGEGPEVILWPDTFNNHFYPDTLAAGARALNAAGYRVRLPARPLCCALPLFAEGMLNTARKLLTRVMDTLSEDIDKGLPVVGLEPSCVASFRDELPHLFPDDERAQYLSKNTYLLGEFLIKANYHPPSLQRRAVIHTHCHQHASLDPEADRELYNRLGLDYTVLDSGCCGMAGSFGFREGNYRLSQRIAEHELLPAIREADTDTLLVTNGFSCREQIVQATGRASLNIAELLDMAISSRHP